MAFRVLRKKRNKRRRGAALVEMAVVLPVFFMIIMGIVEFGRAMMVTQVVTNCAREATRTAVLEGTTNSDINTFVTDYLSQTMDLTSGDVTTTITVQDANGTDRANNDVTAAQRLDLVKVHIAVPYSKVNFIPIRWLEGSSVSGQSVMRREH